MCATKDKNVSPFDSVSPSSCTGATLRLGPVILLFLVLLVNVTHE